MFCYSDVLLFLSFKPFSISLRLSSSQNSETIVECEYPLVDRSTQTASSSSSASTPWYNLNSSTFGSFTKQKVVDLFTSMYGCTIGCPPPIMKPKTFDAFRIVTDIIAYVSCVCAAVLVYVRTA